MITETKTLEKAKLDLLRVASLKPSRLPEKNAAGNMTYTILYVSQGGQEVNHPCTERVWKMVKNNRMPFLKKQDFMLTLEGNIVTEVSPQDRISGLAGFQIEADDASSIQHKLVMTKRADGVFVAKSLPERVTSAMLDEINAMLARTDHIEAGMLLGDAYMIEEIRNTVSGETIIIDPYHR